MPQPQGAELEKIRARRAELRERYLRPPGQRPPTPVRGVHHLALICRDVEETIQFYQEFLGFPLVELVENRDYAGSSHFFFDIGNKNMLGFFDFPGHDHPAWQESIYFRDPNGVGLELYREDLGEFDGRHLID